MAIRGKMKGAKAGASKKQKPVVLRHDELRLTVEYLAVKTLLPYANNARLHSDDQVKQIAASIAEFGFNDPVAVDPDNVIIEGHGRVMAAAQLALAMVPVLRLGHMSEAEAKAYRLAHNKTALNSQWSKPMLRLEISTLREMGKLHGLDLPMLAGFENKELRSLEGQTDAKENKGFGIGGGESKEGGFGLLVTLKDEEARDELLDRLRGEGFECEKAEGEE